MYTYIRNINSSTPLTDTLSVRVKDELKKLHIIGDILEFDSEKTLHSLLLKIDSGSTNTLVVIGDDKDLEIVIGQIGALKDGLAIGYLPITDSELAKTLNIKDWASGAEALAQRKIKEMDIYSIGGRYFFARTELKFEKDRTKLPIGISIDGNLNLNLPYSKVILENSTQEQYHSNKPLLITAYEIKNDEATKSENIFKIIKNKVNNESSQADQILHISARAIRIYSTNIIKDGLGRPYKNTITVGKNHKKIRLITKKSSRS